MYPSVKLSQLFVGSSITIYARQLNIIDYGDLFTKNTLGKEKARTVCVIKSSALARTGSILTTIAKLGFVVSQIKMVKLTTQQAQQYYGEASHPISPRARDLSQGPIIALEVVGDDAPAKIAALSQAEGKNAVISTATSSSPSSASSGTATSSFSTRPADAECDFFFNNKSVGTTAQFSDCSVCVIKPHSLTDGHAGAIIDSIVAQGYQISAMEQFTLDRSTAQEFLEVYKTVVAEYANMVAELHSGPCLVLEVRAQDAVKRFRELCGPSDPEIARHIRPQTLRAKFGANKIKNALHCTDLPEDGVLESEFFFSIMQK